MSPLVAAPNRGYADYQRLDNWDSGILWNEVATGVSTPTVSPLLDMSRYAYCGGIVANGSTNTCYIQFDWFADSAATIALGTRAFTLNVNIPVSAQIRIPNLGPFLRITFFPVAGTAYNPIAQIVGTNRVHPHELIPPRMDLVICNQGLAAGVNTFFPSFYYSGPCIFQGIATNGGNTVTFKYLHPTNTFVIFDEVLMTTAGQIQRFNTVVPAGYWWVEIFNTAAPGSVTQATVSYTSTGSD